MTELAFKSDTKFRKKIFIPESFAHPAKMHSQLLIWLVEHYTELGEVILDPMAGSGTTMLACMFGRNVVLVELEEKFCKMMRDNWELVKMKPQLGCQMGTCQIIRDDARNLEGLLADKIITSPPFKTGVQPPNKESSVDAKIASTGKTRARGYSSFGKIAQLGSENPNNIDNLPYGDIDKIITSPPYTNRMDGGGEPMGQFAPYSGDRKAWRTQRPQNNIGNKPYGNIDSIITSPPYEKVVKERGADNYAIIKEKGLDMSRAYSGNESNIGNLKSDTYLEAMLSVYSQCFKVLKDGGLMILVTKNFIRNKQVVRLDTDTIKLCEQAGFSYVERYQRRLPAQSFWRVIYQKKFPDVEQIKHEDILVFQRA